MMNLADGSVKFCISTCRLFFEHSLPVILSSLHHAGVKPSEIVVINGGWEASLEDEFNGSRMVLTRQNSIDLTALIEVVEREINSEYWFLLHDTCIAGPSFKELVYDVPANCPQKVALRSHPSMNIGLYKMEYLMTNQAHLLQAKNLDHSPAAIQYWKRWAVINEDHMLWNVPATPTHVYHQHLHPPDGYILHPDEDVYGTGKIRRMEYFPQLDLLKAKSNWQGLTERMVVDI
jgi:hypothetical protein